MVASAVQVAKRVLLATMRAVALSFRVAMTCNRDSPDRDVVKNFRVLALRVHPDRLRSVPGGRVQVRRYSGQWVGTLSQRFRWVDFQKIQYLIYEARQLCTDIGVCVQLRIELAKSTAL